ncbi:MAG: response regulator [Deltaproteobacteria bacterium]|nr:response regulator [Deltaproteobacteria bacterium]
MVDDNDENLYLLETIFKGEGHQVFKAKNGMKALEYLSDHKKIDLIVSDILMPIMDGFQFCKRVKKDSQLNNIPFVFYTATYTGEKDKELARKIGADRFIVKPIEIVEFLHICNNVTSESVRKKKLKKNSVPSRSVDDKEIFKFYSERLVNKLEKKVEETKMQLQALEKSEKALSNSEEKYRNLFNSIRDAILVTDFAGKIVDCNGSFIELFGYSLTEITGKSISFLCEEPSKFNKITNNSITDNINSGFIIRSSYFKKSREKFPGKTTVSLLKDYKSKNCGYICMIIDKTRSRKIKLEQKNLKNQLQQAQKMESIGTLAGGIAHDYNNMLGVIIGHIDLAKDYFTPADPVWENLTEMEKAARHSANLTEQLLGFARKQTISPRVVNLNNSIKKFSKLLASLIREEINIIWKPGKNIKNIFIDPSQLKQLLINLVGNAGDAINGYGNITIATENVFLDQSRNSDCFQLNQECVILSVKDDGLGITEEIKEKIFEPFFTTKDVNKGTGLGLANVYGIVKQNDGMITVESIISKETVFKIYFPVYSEKGTDPTDKLHSEKQILPGNETILLVEDNAAILKSTAIMLEKLGYKVISMTNPIEAIKMAEIYSESIDLLFTDVVMQQINGRQLYQKLNFMLPNLKCLYMSGYSSDIIAKHGILKDGTTFIKKPFKKAELAQAIRYSLSKKNKPGSILLPKKNNQK